MGQKKILITGSSGMLGRHLLASCLKNSLEIVATSRTKPAFIAEGVPWVPWDLSDPKNETQLESMFPEVTHLIHAGCHVPSGPVTLQDILNPNVEVCRSLASWALKRNIHVTFISGAIVYADHLAKGITEDAPKATQDQAQPYGYSKILAENIFLEHQSKGLTLCILRPSSIYGDGLGKDKMISRFLRQAQNNEKIVLKPPFDEAINLVHAADVAQATLKAVSSSHQGIYNIAYSKSYPVSEIAATCVEAMGKGSMSAVPSSANYKTRYDLSCKKAVNELQFKPEISLFDGLKCVVKKRVLP